MGNKKGLEMAISTIVLLVIGLAVLIGLILLLRNGILGFNAGTKPFLETSGASAVKSACELACTTGNRFTFCCGNFTVSNQKIKCTDDRLEVGCGLSCEGFACGGSVLENCLYGNGADSNKIISTNICGVTKDNSTCGNVACFTGAVCNTASSSCVIS